jgi:hypothetical protein
MKNLTSRFWEASRMQARDEQFLALLTLIHPQLAPPIRACCDLTSVVSRGETYVGWPFSFERVSDDEESPELKIAIQNVDKRIGEAVLPLKQRLRLDLEIILREEPDTVIESVKYLNLVDVEITAIDVTGTLVGRNYATKPYPGISATQERCPALWYQ